MSKAIYLINPEPSPGFHAKGLHEHLGLEPAAHVNDLSTTTVAASVPDDFQIEVCDEFISPADLDHPADFIGLTSKVGQMDRLGALSSEFRRRGKIVIIGGPLATLSPKTVRSHCDILVRGEIEGIAPRLFADLRRGNWKAEYDGGRPDLNSSPLPRWDLYPNHRAMIGCVQTSRGCPYNCEFCDVVQYAGRGQRFKPVDHVLAELDLLYEIGYRHIFLADDNLTANQSRAVELLTRIRDWNLERKQGAIRFLSQLSMDTVDNDKLLKLCFQCNVKRAFIGIETPNQSSLHEVNKSPNLNRDLVADVRRFYAHGIAIDSFGMVGFDNDGPDIFEHHYQFAMEAPLPDYLPVVLDAPPKTPLFKRFEKENRLTETIYQDTWWLPWWTNIIPKQMSRKELFLGLRWLINNLYEPNAYCDRLLRFISLIKEQPSRFSNIGGRRQVDVENAKIIKSIKDLDPESAAMLSKVFKKTAEKPAAATHIGASLYSYRQMRNLYQQNGMWDPRLVGIPPLG